MDIFKQQEMLKNRPQVTSKLNDWHDWLVNHVPKTVKDKASSAFKTFENKVMGLYNRVKGGNERETKIENKPSMEWPPNQKQIKRMKKS